MLTQERLKELLCYNPLSGAWAWVSPNPNYRNGKAGEPAGGPDENGYLRIRVDGKRYRAGRLAFLYMLGYLPAEMVDHWDRDSSNDRWENLREATNSQNQANVSARAHNKSGLKGVDFVARIGKFRSQIRVDGRTKHLCVSKCPAVAHFAYIVAASKLYGEFARVA